MGTGRDRVERLFAAIDSKQFDRLDEVFAPGAELISPDGAFKGSAEIGAYMASWNAGFPDFRHTIDAAVEGDGVVAIEARWTGTHTGPLAAPTGDIPATGKEVTLWFAGVTRYEGDLVTSVHAYFDRVALMAQLGLIPTHASA